MLCVRCKKKMNSKEPAAAAAAPPFLLLRLPYNVLDTILCYLSVRDLVSLSHTCSVSRSVVDEDLGIWARLATALQLLPCHKEVVVLSALRPCCGPCGGLPILEHIFGTLLTGSNSECARRTAESSRAAFESRGGHAGVIIGKRSGFSNFGKYNICIGHDADVHSTKTNYSAQIGMGCVGRYSNTIHLGSQHYHNLVLMFGSNGVIPAVEQPVSDASAEQAGVPLGGVYTAAGADPSPLYVRMK